ncbi:MAG: polysaccharide export protein [Cytophagales bacterium]|nr:polysaccharide export protein [Cytophagales bacterium]
MTKINRLWLGKLLSGFVFTLAILTINGCISHKNTILIREKQATAAFDSLTSMSTVAPDYKLQPKDILSIQVSSFRPEITSFFNSDKTGLFTVQDNGYIYIPLLDSIQVGNMTLDQVRKNLRLAIRFYASDAYVSVNMMSFNITVLGEVGTPGVKNIPRDRVTLMEVLGLAGGITDFGNRKKVKVLRKEGDGVNIVLIDITNENILLSKYYYMVPGDVVYVEPINAKTLTFNIRQVSLFLGFATLAYVINILLARIL